MKAKVFIRNEQTFKDVKISSSSKPEIDPAIIEKWQHIINLTAKIVNVPSGLIMRITDESMKVFLRSDNPNNPYKVGAADKLGKGLYCETVIGQDKELSIENALSLELWKDNPDVALNMISYYGLPIKWPDGEFFGTICILDNKSHAFSDDFKDVMRELRNSIEKDLLISVNRQQLIHSAEFDLLTGIYNRRKMDQLIAMEFDRCQRTGDTFSVVLIDLNRFKEINDTYGHNVGDQVLKQFAISSCNRVRKTDSFGRWGGDEFLFLCPATSADQIFRLVDDLYNDICSEVNSVVTSFSFSYGIAEFRPDDEDYESVIKRADKLMYEMKSRLYNK